MWWYLHVGNLTWSADAADFWWGMSFGCRIYLPEISLGFGLWTLYGRIKIWSSPGWAYQDQDQDRVISTITYLPYICIYIYILYIYTSAGTPRTICQPGFRMTPVLRKGAWTQPNFKHLQSQARHRMSPPSPLFLHPPKLGRSSATPPEEKCPDMTRPSNECSDLFLYFPGESCCSGGLGLQWLTVSVNGRLTCLTWWLMVVTPSSLI